MKRYTLNEDVKNEIIETIEKNKSDGCNDNQIAHLIKKLNEVNFFSKDITTQNDEEAIYMYNDLNIIELSKFLNMHLDSREIGYSNISKKILINVKYIVEYENIFFELILSYQFSSFKIECEELFLEPYIFVASKAVTTLIDDDKIIWEKVHKFTFPKNTYLEKVSELEFEINPHLKNRNYEIIVFENDNKEQIKSNDNFKDVLKLMINMLIDETNIIDERDLIIENSQTDIYLEDVNVETDLVYNDIIIGKISKKDTLRRYEVTFKIQGISKYIKVYVYLTEDEYNEKVSLKKYILSELKVKRVNLKESVYYSKKEYIFGIIYCDISDIHSCIKSQMYCDKIEYEDKVAEILSEITQFETVAIDIKNKNLPFSKVIFFKNVLKITKKSDVLKNIKLFDIGYETIVVNNEKLYMIKKYIIIIKNEVFEIELSSELKQGKYKVGSFNINLPIILSKDVVIHYRNIKSQKELDDIFLHKFNMSKKKLEALNIISLSFLVSINKIINEINLRYQEYFNDISIGFDKNIDNIKSQVNNSLAFKGYFDVYNFVTSKYKKEKRIKISKRALSSLEDDEDLENITLFSDGYVVGYKTNERNCKLEFTLEQTYADMTINSADLGLKKSLYRILLSSINYFLIPKDFNKEDEMVKVYIEAVINKYKD